MGNVASSDASEALNAPPSSVPSALVIVGPSGVGKGTLINRLKEGNDRFGFSCSHTTRHPREGEQDGVHYHFTTKEAFEREITEGKFLEYAYVHDNIYGTSIRAVEDVATRGRCCILDIDVQGARQVRAANLPAIFVFIAPPSLDALEQRLRGRGTESEEQITTRLENARKELKSMDEPGLYDHVIVNADLERCLAELRAIAARALAGEVGGPPVVPLNRDTIKHASPLAPASSHQPQPHSQHHGEPSTGTTSPAPAGHANGGAVFRGDTASSSSHPQEPPSATVSLRGWLNDPGSPDALAFLHSGLLGQTLLLKWRGRVAIVTGAGAGVGWSVALALATAGVRVVAVSRYKALLEALQDAAVAANVTMSDFLPVVCDTAKEQEVDALHKIIAKQWPGSGVHLLVNATFVERASSQSGGDSDSDSDSHTISSYDDGKGGDGGGKAAVPLPGGGTSSTLTTMGGNVSQSIIAGWQPGVWADAIAANVLGSALVARAVVRDMLRHGEPGHVVTVVPCRSRGENGGGDHGGGAMGGISAVVAAALQELAAQIRAETAGTAVHTSCVSLEQPQRRRHQQQQGSENGNGRGDGMGAEEAAAVIQWCLSAPAPVNMSDVVVGGERLKPAAE